jgi:hypothetical protein
MEPVIQESKKGTTTEQCRTPSAMRRIRPYSYYQETDKISAGNSNNPAKFPFALEKTEVHAEDSSKLAVEHEKRAAFLDENCGSTPRFTTTKSQATDNKQRMWVLHYSRHFCQESLQK